MGAHDYNGTNPSRAARKQSKLGPGIVTSKRLEELLGWHVEPRVTPLLELAEELGDMADGVMLTKAPDGTVTARVWEGTNDNE